jgi:preprotein translocase subunit SecE
MEGGWRLKRWTRGGSMFGKMGEFFREVAAELKKVSWPSREETVASTGIVLLVTVIVSFYLGFIDVIISSVIRRFF